MATVRQRTSARVGSAALLPLSLSTRETLDVTRDRREASKQTAQDYLQYSVSFTQKGMKWKDVANPRLAGQVDRVLSKVTHYYGETGKKRRIGDIMIAAELSKLVDLIYTSPTANKRLLPSPSRRTFQATRGKSVDKHAYGTTPRWTLPEVSPKQLSRGRSSADPRLAGHV